MLQCPACHELIEALTNHHCITRHNITKGELIQQHGEPQYARMIVNSSIARWIKQNHVKISKADFEMAQSAIRSVANKA